MKVGIKLRKNDLAWKPYIEELKKISDVDVLYDGKLAPLYPEIDVLITTNISENILDRFPKLKRIFLPKTGMDELPLKKLKEKGIEVHPSHANADVIAEHALALSLALLHRIPEFDKDLRDGCWYSNGNNYTWKSISDLQIGILGYGNIGKSLHQKLSGFKNEVYAYNQSGIYQSGAVGVRSITELVIKSDLIFVCLPKTIKTKDIFNQEILQKMKGKYLVNIGRAEVCNEKALYEALETGVLAGYASDVWCLKPDKMNKLKKSKPSNFPFENLKNVIMSPHCATHEINAHERYIRDSVESCKKYIRSRESI